MIGPVGHGGATARIGVVADVQGTPADAIVQQILLAEEMGTSAMWIAQPPTGLDALGLAAVAAATTTRVGLGTAVVPVHPRHPLALAGQVRLVEDLAPGRLRLGIGPSHRPMIEGIYGLRYEQPLRYVREYVQVLRAALWDGSIDHEGHTFRIHAEVGQPTRTPILLSALGPRSFSQAGEISDGAISWMCPLAYLRDVARPAMVEGAARANRDVPPLIAHVLVAMSVDEAAVVAAVERRVAFYASLPAYAGAFTAAGHEITDAGSIRRLAFELVVSGDEKAVRDGLRRVLESGIDEVAAHLVVIADRAEEARSLHGVIASLES